MGRVHNCWWQGSPLDKLPIHHRAFLLVQYLAPGYLDSALKAFCSRCSPYFQNTFHVLSALRDELRTLCFSAQFPMDRKTTGQLYFILYYKTTKIRTQKTKSLIWGIYAGVDCFWFKCLMLRGILSNAVVQRLGCLMKDNTNYRCY